MSLECVTHLVRATYRSFARRKRIDLVGNTSDGDFANLVIMLTK